MKRARENGERNFVVSSNKVKWTARRVGNEHIPKRWGEFVSNDVLRLKDTRGRYYRNHLRQPNEFVYQIPRTPHSPWETQLTQHIPRGLDVRPARDSATGSRNESYGRWVACRHCGFARSSRTHPPPSPRSR